MEDRDAQALQMLAPLSGPFLPWTSYALRPEAILTFLNAIVLVNAAQIVECGSGLSTVYAARLFAQQGGGHLHTIEEDPEWGKRVLEQLRREGIDEHVTMHLVPLGADWWYREEDLEPLLTTPIDVLLVDGPSNRRRGRALDSFATRSRPTTSSSSTTSGDPRSSRISARGRSGSAFAASGNTARAGSACFNPPVRGWTSRTEALQRAFRARDPAPARPPEFWSTRP